MAVSTSWSRPDRDPCSGGSIQPGGAASGLLTGGTTTAAVRSSLEARLSNATVISGPNETPATVPLLLSGGNCTEASESLDEDNRADSDPTWIWQHVLAA
jgi:hypothetical protein